MNDAKPNIEITSILIAEDHELFGDGIAFLLESLFPNAQITRALDFDNAWQCLQSNTFDLMLMDLKMPGTKGLNGVRATRQSYPSQKLIVMSSLDSAMNAENVMTLGVNGFISKSTAKEKMKQGILDVVHGKTVVETPHTTRTSLSPRQQQTLEFMAQGLSNKEIARQLNISVNTAKEYVSIVISSLNADNRTHAVQKAEQLGLLFDCE
jgi:DNA-binding NarL/FixJ family response regulator